MGKKLASGGIVSVNSRGFIPLPEWEKEPKPSLFSDTYYENLIFNMVNMLDKEEKKAIFLILKDYLRANGRIGKYDICRY